MAIGNARILTFDTGIERIIPGGEPVAPPLPERDALTPTGEPLRARLDEILNAPASDERLRASLRPQVADKTILAPSRYQTLLGEARAELRDRAGGARDALGRAAALLDEEQQLRDLFNTLRATLIQA